MFNLLHTNNRMVHSNPKDLQIYRAINLLYVPYLYYIGSLHNDKLLKLLSIMLFVVDGYLLYFSIDDLFVLQFLRFCAFMVLGPILMIKGDQYRDGLLSIIGSSFVVADGLLFFKFFSG